MSPRRPSLGAAARHADGPSGAGRTFSPCAHSCRDSARAKRGNFSGSAPFRTSGFATCVRFGAGGGHGQHLGLQGHAAPGAGPGPIPSHLGIHGANVHRAGRRWLVGRRCLFVFFGMIGFPFPAELGPALSAAEPIGGTPVFQVMGAIGGHRHATYRVGERTCFFSGVGRRMAWTRLTKTHWFLPLT